MKLAVFVIASDEVEEFETSKELIVQPTTYTYKSTLLHDGVPQEDLIVMDVVPN